MVEEYPKRWNLRFFDGLTTEKIIDRLISRFTFLTQLTIPSMLNDDKIITSYFGKGNTFKKIGK